jgi:hypothetical protein
MRKISLTRGYRSQRSKLITIKCKHCGVLIECFLNSLCSQLGLCGECIKKIWGTEDFLDKIKYSECFTEGDYLYYKNLFKIRD